MEILKQQVQKAKKVHKCDYCGMAIPSGELYEYSAIKNGSDFYIWKNHIDCQRLALKLNMFEGSQDGVCSDMFWEYIHEYINDIPYKEKLEIAKQRLLNENI